MNAVCQPVNEFTAYFSGCEVSPRRDQAMFQAVQKLRYQVYCEECGFLRPEDFPDGLEHDEHDVNSAHFVALDLQQELAGYVRLVRADAVQTFPFQMHCVALSDGVVLPPAEQAAEISRLMVHRSYRRRQGERPPVGASVDEAMPPAGVHELRNPSPLILLNMYRQAYAYSLRNDIRYWYAAMERSLARILTRMNFGFQQIGPATDYYGPVAPYMADLRVLERQLGQQNPALLAWMRSSAELP